jgi:tetratricopeptide (TPR) repeat protein
MDQQQIEELHQQASEHYLNGRFEDALHAWRQLLELNPDDDRATEGLRLCTLMTKGDVVTPDLGTPAEPAPVETPPEPPPAAEEGAADIDLDLSVLDSLSAEKPQAPAAEAPQSSPPEPPPADSAGPDPSRQAEGLDFGDLAATDSIPLGEQVPQDEPRRGLEGVTQAAPEAEPEATGLEPVDSGSQKRIIPPHAEEPDPDPVEDQLKRRVRELLTDARAAADEGRSDEALSILARIAILDEDNDAARELEESLRQQASQCEQEIEHWLTEGVQWMEQGRLEEARERFESVLSRAPEHMEARAYLEQLDEREAGGDSEPEPEAADSPPSPAEPAEEPGFQEVPVGSDAPPETVPLARSMPGGDGPEAAPLHTVPVPSAPQKRQLRKPVLFGGILVLVLAVGGVGWFVLRGDSGGGAAVNAASIGAAVANLDAAPGPEGSGGASDDSQARETTADSQADADVASRLSPLERAERVDAAMARAADARQRRDWEAAILAYNQALSLDPHNPDARTGLFETGEIYKQERAILDQLRKARIAFEDGEYSAALRLFYRLPEGSVDPVVINRYMFNGWFNLAVFALKAGDTGRALDHLDEALNLDPDHALSIRLHSLASRYDGRARDRAYYLETNQIEFRGLED